MTPVNLYYEVENAFVQMDDALENARQHATPEGTLLYGRLMDELIGIRDRARQELLDLYTKKAAPAVGATETASDSPKESTFSLDEKPEEVKRSRLILNVIDDETIECELSIHGPSTHLLRLYSAAVETIHFAAPKYFLFPRVLESAHKVGMRRAAERLHDKSKDMFLSMSESAQDALVRLAKELNLPDEFLQKFTGGAEK